MVEQKPSANKGTFLLYKAQDGAVKEATISILETVRQDGSREVKKQLEYYSLD